MASFIVIDKRDCSTRIVREWDDCWKNKGTRGDILVVEFTEYDPSAFTCEYEPGREATIAERMLIKTLSHLFCR